MNEFCGAGDTVIRGPRHLDRLETTSARRDKSANSTFGWALSLLHASSVGISSEFSCEDDAPELTEEDGQVAQPGPLALQQRFPPEVASD